MNLNGDLMNSKKVLCLVDGEHYLPVTKDAINTLNSKDEYDVIAAVFIGGTEKLRDDNEESYTNILGFVLLKLKTSLMI